MPHLVEMHEEFGGRGVAVIGMTKAPLDEAEAFRQEHGASYALLANAGAAFERYGIGAVWSSPVYVVDPEGRIAAEGLDEGAALLRRRVPSR